MVIFINILVMLLTEFEYLSFCYVFFRKKVNKKISGKLAGILFVAAVIVFSGIMADNDIIMLSQIVSTLIIIYCFFGIGFFDALKMWLIGFPMLMMMEYVPYLFYSPDFFNKYQDVISISVIIVLIWLYFFITRNKYTEEMFILKGRVWIFISVELFVLMFLIFSFTFPILKETDITELKLAVVIISIICVVILNLFLFRHYNSNYANKLENKYLGLLNKQQRDHFELLLSKEEETRRFRHDIANELAELKMLLENDKKDEALLFINDVYGEIKNIKEKNYSVGNESVDIMLNYILSPVRELCYIEVNGFLGEDINISSKDLCIVVSNILTNAVEEIKKQQPDKGSISFFASRGSNNILLRVKNTLADKSYTETSLLPETSKKDKKNHGIGLNNVKRIVEKNRGALSIDDQNGIFNLEIVMRCPEQD